MIYRFINSLPRTWRYRAQRLWMHIRDFRDWLWSHPSPVFLQGAVMTPIAVFLLLGLINLLFTLSNFIWYASLAYAAALLLLGLVKGISGVVARRTR